MMYPIIIVVLAKHKLCFSQQIGVLIAKEQNQIWDDFTSEYNGKEVGFYKINCQSVDCTDGNSELIQEYNIDGYPTIILLKDNKRINYDARITGENLKQFVEDTLGNK